jgi:hypothetical protein
VGIAPNFKFSPYKLVLKFDFLLAISSLVGAVPPPKIGTFMAPTNRKLIDFYACLWSTCEAIRHTRSIVHEWPEANHESDEHIESTRRTSLAALSSGMVRAGPERRTLKSLFEWVPEQLSRFLTNLTLAKLLEHPGQ